MANDEDFLVELQKEFLDEASFLLEQCEESYLKLEVPEARNEELGKIFRLAHSMKGAGAAVGFADLASFAHLVEDYLTILRAYPDLVDQNTISALLKSGDAFKARISMLRRKDESPWQIDPLKEEFRNLIAAASAARGTALPNSAKAPANEAPTEPAVATATAAVTVVPANAATPTLPPVTTTSEPVSKPAATSPAAVPVKQTAANSKGGESNSIKIDTDRIESVLNLVGELVVIKSQLINETQDYSSNLKLGTIVSLLDKTIRELQEQTLTMRMTPLKGLFLKTQRIVRDLSIKLNKPIDFQMHGEDTEIDRSMVELLNDPLMHITRNALDHGLEKPEVRKTRGKPEKGTIHLSAQQAGGRILIKVRDDGNGISREKILKKAIEKGVLPKDANPATMKDKEVYDLIFAPGFSTAEAVTDISGRGVGLDVVKTNIEKLRGNIEIETVQGQGSTFVLSVPLTTSIIDGILVSIANQVYIVPMDVVTELVDLNGIAFIPTRGGNNSINIRGKILPLLNLHRILNPNAPRITSSNDSEKGMAVVVRSEAQLAAMQVDAVLGQIQVVLKSLNSEISNAKGVAGAAILGNGAVALVLNIDGVIQSIQEAGSQKLPPAQHDRKAVAI